MVRARRSWVSVSAAGSVILLLTACAGPNRAVPRFEPAVATYFTVEVKQGDSLSKIARAYQVEEDDLLALNNIPDRNRLKAGSSLRVPAYASLRRDDDMAAIAPPRPADTPIETRPMVPPPSRQRITAAPLPQPRAGQTAPAPAPAQSSWMDFDWLTVTPEIDPSVRFLWPVEGRVISSFGPRATGGRNDGINISTPRGTPVKAAADGTVTYVGNELKGYGNLVLIRHDNGYITAYAHTESVAVTRGERVARGKVIAHTGATGNVTEPQLHFELRVGTKPVDPQPYLVASM